MPVIDIVEGDTLPRLIIQFIDHETETAIDCTGGSAKLTWSLNGGANVEKTLTSLDLPLGKWYYRPSASDFVAGKAVAQGEFKDSLLQIGTAVEDLTIIVHQKRRAS